MSPAPPRKRLSRSHEDGSVGAVSPTASAASATDEGDSTRSTSGSNAGYLVRLGQPIRGRKALELAAKLEMSSENDRKRLHYLKKQQRKKDHGKKHRPRHRGPAPDSIFL